MGWIYHCMLQNAVCSTTILSSNKWPYATCVWRGEWAYFWGWQIIERLRYRHICACSTVNIHTECIVDHLDGTQYETYPLHVNTTIFTVSSYLKTASMWFTFPLPHMLFALCPKCNSYDVISYLPFCMHGVAHVQLSWLSKMLYLHMCGKAIHTFLKGKSRVIVFERGNEVKRS